MKKKWIIIIAVVAVLVTAGFFYLKFRSSKDFEPLIKSKLQALVKDGSNGLYQLEIGRIDVDVVGSRLVVLNAQLSIDSARLQMLDQQKQAPNDIYKVSFKNLVIEGVGADDILKRNNIDLDVLSLNEPSVEVFHHKRDYNYIAPDTGSLYQRIAQQIGHFSVKLLNVQNVDFTYHNMARQGKQQAFRNVSMRFKDMLIDSTTQNDSTLFLFSKDAYIFLKDYAINTPDNLYTFHIDSMALGASAHLLNLSGLTLKPKGKKEDFSKKLQVYKDRYDIDIATASIKNIDWWGLLSEDGFNAQEISLQDGSIEVFADRTLPAPNNNKVGNYPHQMLMKLNMPVSVNKITTDNFKVTYRELNEKSHKTGSVVFDKVKATFSNVTNKPDEILQNKYFTLDADCKLMSAGPLHAIFKFDLANAKDGNFSLDIDVDKMSGTKLNQATVPLGLFEIKSADINKISVHIDASNYQSKGTVVFLYDNLEVSVLKADEDEKTKVKKRGLISFIANSFIIKKSNDKQDKNDDIKRVSYKRDPHKSFFNLIWKTLFEGLSQTVKGKN